MGDRPEYLGLRHASLLVADLAQALAFYCDVLGMGRVPRPAMDYDGAWLDAGGQQLHLLALPNPDPVSGRPAHGGRDRHVAIAVRDLTVLRRRLEAAGVPFRLSRSGRAALFCRDPDGNALEFIEESLAGPA